MSEVDHHVGSRLRMTREFRGISGATLAGALSIEVSRLDMLEGGKARLDPGELLAAARLLRVSPSFFFDVQSLNDASRIDAPTQAASALANDNGCAPAPSDRRPQLRLLQGG